MQNILIDLLTALPELIVLGMAMLILLIGLFSKNNIAIYVLAQATLLIAAFFIVGTHTPAVGYAFTGMFVDDTLSTTPATKLFVVVYIHAPSVNLIA